MRDLKTYVNRMALSMTKEEKLFFVDKIDLYSYNAIVDFGGAEGLLLHEVQKLYPDLAEGRDFYVVDNNPQMKDVYKVENCVRVSYLEDLKPLIMGGRVLLILSSVLHEVTDEVFEQIYQFCQKFVSTVVIRDMMYQGESVGNPWNLRRDLAIARTGGIYQIIQESPEYAKKLEEMIPYCEQWGYDWKETLTLFVLKCDYTENWETEVKENYFCGNCFKLARKLGLSKKWWTPYDKYYVLPYMKAKAGDLFNFALPKTHMQVIMERF